MASSTTGQAPGKKISKPISSKVRFFSSNLASIISVTFCFPLEVMKTRMQIQVRIVLFILMIHVFLYRVK